MIFAARCTIPSVFLLLFAQSQADGRQAKVKLHADRPYVSKGENTYQELCIANADAGKYNIILSLYRYSSATDSTKEFSKSAIASVKNESAQVIRFELGNTDTTEFIEEKFHHILVTTGGMPAGNYKLLITVAGGADTIRAKQIWTIDSSLAVSSKLRRDINNIIKPENKLPNVSVSKKRLPLAGARGMQHAQHKIEHRLRKKGFYSVFSEGQGKTKIDVFYKDIYVGRYEAIQDESLPDQLSRQQIHHENPASGMSLTTMDQPTIFSQFKSNKAQNDQQEIRGDISLSNNVGSGQDQGAGMDNNFTEVRGMLEVPVLGLPFDVEGLYTTQDKHREIKSSYIKVHYDVDKMKERMMGTVSSYNQKYAEYRSKGDGMQHMYATALDNLERRRATLIVQAENTASTAKKDAAKDVREEETQEAQSLKDSTKSIAKEPEHDSTLADGDKKRKQAKQEIEQMDRQIDHYKTMLKQYENTRYFDSVVTYNKTKNIPNENMNYKQMAKRSQSLFPDGKVRSFVSGITAFDAGMFVKNTSKYTDGGQMMKGVHVGYDLGICEIQASAGKVEFAHAGGGVDRYTSYSVQSNFKLSPNEKVSINYYGYTPDRKLYENDVFFKNGIYSPTFYRPVQIPSISYEGKVSKHVDVKAETATSIKQDNNAEHNVSGQLNDKTAYSVSANAAIPNSGCTITTAYDKVGKNFENATLPVLMAGTEQYKVSVRNDFFRNRLSVGVEYDRLIQYYTSSRAINSKWGFDVKANWKRYPSVSLSYKPFTTFRSLTDTLNIPQRPMIGSVWTGRTSYQFRKDKKTIRLNLLYSANSTVMDTSRMATRLLQAGLTCNTQAFTYMLTAGYTEVQGTNAATTLASPAQMVLMSSTVSYNLSKLASINGGQELGFSKWGICRWAANVGTSFRPAKVPVGFRLMLRYNTYQLTQGSEWRNVYAGCLELNYRFKKKLEKN